MSSTPGSKRIVIVGAGVIGLAAACYCARRGLRVTVIERRGLQRDGCSFGNAGMICPSHFVPLAAPGMMALGLKWMWNPKSPFYIRPRFDLALFNWGLRFWRASTTEHVNRAAPLLRDLNLASRAEFEAMAAAPGVEFNLVRKGLLMLCRTRHALDEESELAERAHQLGLPAEVLSAEQAAALDPGIRMDILGAVHFPSDAHLSPDRFMATLQKEALERQVEFHWDTEISGWHFERGRIVAARTSRGDFAADDFVVCGGSWSPGVVRDLGLRLPMQAGKGYSLTLPHPPRRPTLCAILCEAKVAVTPMGDALRFGGTMELAGMDESINPVRVAGIVEAARTYYPDIQSSDFEGIQQWRGLRPVSPDGLPYLGRSRRISNLIIATGHAMLGLSLGPITGKIVAQLAAEERPDIDIGLLAPERYG